MHDILLTVIFSFIAVAFFAVGMHAPWRTVLIAAVDGTIGYMLYLLLCKSLAESVSVFYATLVICLIAEIIARKIKAPATIISFTAMVPLVPGIMLYRTMLFFAAGSTSEGIASTINTLIFAGSMSLAVTLATLITKIIFKRKDLKEKFGLLHKLGRLGKRQ